jgi:AraC family transcriptional regulator
VIRPYDLLESVLIDIEKGIGKGIDSGILAKKHALSERHLRRVFTFAFKQSLAGYIRSRKLAASLDDLLKTDSNILDIALEYGFCYEQSYISAFKREFGVTPGDFRRSGHIVKVKPPLHLFDENKMPDGLFFGPDIVMVPRFHIVGKLHRIPIADSVTLAPEAGRNFWYNERAKIKAVVNPDVYIGMTRKLNYDTGFSEYMPSVQVEKFKDIPQGLSEDTFDSALCAKFRYMGQHHYSVIDRKVATSMYEAIWKFAKADQCKYTLLRETGYFERIDTGLYDGTYCQMEWFVLVEEKDEK